MRLKQLRYSRQKSLLNRGFALPTVLIAGLLLLIIGASAMQATASTTRSIMDEYWNRLAAQAKESGAEYVENCMKRGAAGYDPTLTWNSTVTSQTTCGGIVQGSYPENVASSPASANMPAWRTKFTASKPIKDPTTGKKHSKLVGIVEILAASGAVSRTYSSSSTVIINIAGSVEGIGIQTTKISQTEWATCVVLSNNRGFCTGRNDYGQLGDGTLTNKSIPVEVKLLGGVKVSDINQANTNGEGQTCVSGSDYQMYCAGSNNFNALGRADGTPTSGAASKVSNFDVPYKLPAGLTVSSPPEMSNFFANYPSICIIASDSDAYCNGGAGIIYGLYPTAPSKWMSTDPAIVPAGQKPMKIVSSVNAPSTCALTTLGKLYCGGINLNGMFGTGNYTHAFGELIEGFPSVTGQGPIVDVGMGEFKTCALYASSRLYCAGKISSSYETTTPIQFGDASTFVRDFTLGTDSICALDVYYQARCVGDNASGQFGNGTTVPNTTLANPTTLTYSITGKPNLKPMRVIAADQKICLLLSIPGLESSTGTLSCAGKNTFGGFGNGATSSSVNSFTSEFTLPTGLSVKSEFINRGLRLPERTSSRTSGEFHDSSPAETGVICAIASDGNTYCAGRNDFGQLGDGTTTNNSTPVKFQLPADL